MTTTEVSAKSGSVLWAEPQLFVRNIAEASRFYMGKLGFELVFAHGEPSFYAQMKRGGARLNFRHADRPVFDAAFRAAENDVLSATLVVDDAEALYREFQEAGVAFHQTLQREEWGARTFIVRDPDGNLIAFAGR